jgi:hypothetical protein
MAAEQYDLTIEQGATYTLVITVTSVNLTGYTVRTQGRTSHAATTTVWASPATCSLNVTAAASSTITMTISATVTAAMAAPQVGVWDLEYESAAGVVTRLLEGTFTVTPEVTR